MALTVEGNLLVICDFSWPIIKYMLSAFNHKSLEGYINDCYTIVSSTATFKELPKGSVFTVIHLCLSHIMKCFSFHTKRHFNKKQPPFIMYSCSVIVNCGELNEVAVKHLFVVLLSRHKTKYCLVVIFEIYRSSHSKALIPAQLHHLSLALVSYVNHSILGAASPVRQPTCPTTHFTDNPLKSYLLTIRNDF